MKPQDLEVTLRGDPRATGDPTVLVRHLSLCWLSPNQVYGPLGANNGPLLNIVSRLLRSEDNHKLYCWLMA